MESIKFGIVTVSDSCYKGEKVDHGGPKLVDLLKDNFPESTVLSPVIVSDEIPIIKEMLLELCDKECDVIFTSGGTGIAPRDVTPEATKAVIQREIPGISYALMVRSLAITPFAMLSRAVCGIRNKSLILNLPGSTKAVSENFDIIKTIIPHAVSLIRDNKPSVEDTHQILQSGKNFENQVHQRQHKIFTPSKVKLNTVAARCRSSPYKMVCVNEVYDIIKDVCIQDSDGEVENVRDALGRVLAEDVISLDSLPPYPSSIKDGYAVRSCDGEGKRVVVDGVAAGDTSIRNELQEGQCIRISTGAPVPAGADAVVQVEDTTLSLVSQDNSKELEIEILVKPEVGKDIRKIGSDIDAFSIVLKKGQLLNAVEIGVLAAVGKTAVKVYKRPKVGIISTGNELQDPYVPLETGCIRDSNKTTLMALLKQYGYKGEDFGLVKDEPDSVKRIFEEAFSKCDLVITTGGVSMGEFDVIKRVLLEDFSAKIHFGRVNMKPGKPTTLATCLYNGQIKTIFGLPGNPVSATVTCLLFVISALKYFENRSDIFFPLVRVELQFQPIVDKERPEYQRVQLEFSGLAIKAYTTGNQISSKLNSFVGADGLLLVPAEDKSILTILNKKSQNGEPLTYPSQNPKYWCYLLGKF